MIHELKILPKYFDAVATGIKRFEVRNAEDRKFSVGDVLKLVENEEYGTVMRPTGRTVCVAITYILSSDDFMKGLHVGYVVLSLGEPFDRT